MAVCEMTILDYLRSEAESDCSEVVRQATSGVLGGNNGRPKAVSDTSVIFFQLALDGRLTPVDTKLLQTALQEHLEISQNHARLWIHPDPDPDELAEAWQLQGESLERWDQFVSIYERFGKVHAAYNTAYEGFPSKPLMFRNAEARLVFTTMLKNEQQEFIGSSKREAVHVIKKDRLEGSLEPTHARLLDLIMDGQPKTVRELLLAVFGFKAQTDDNKRHLARRIYELNRKLKALWGNPPQKRWIISITEQGESGYQLQKGKEVF